MKKLLLLLVFISYAQIQCSAASAQSPADAKSSQEDVQTITVPNEIFYDFFMGKEGGFESLMKWLDTTDINNKIVLIPMKHENLLWFKAIDQLSLHDKPAIFNTLFEKNANIAKNLKDILNYLEIHKIPKRNRAQILLRAAAQGESLSSHINKVHSRDYYFAIIERISPHFKVSWESSQTPAEKISIIEKVIDDISKNKGNPDESLQAISSLYSFIKISNFLNYLTKELQAKLIIIEIEKTKLSKKKDQLLPPLLIKAEEFNTEYQKNKHQDPKLKEQLQAILKTR